MTKKVKLSQSDWQLLFPGEEFRIGDTTLLITPLTLEGLSGIVRKLSRIYTRIEEQGIQLDQLGEDGDQLQSLVEIVVDEIPEVMEFMCGLDVEDIRRLPVGITVELFNKCLDVNIDSQKDLLGNLSGLGTKLGQLMSLNQTQTTVSSPQSIS